MNILQTKNVVKRYTNHTALNNVSISVPKGSIYGLLGPNGAGKTSLIRIITQITGADSGEVLIHGEPLMPKHTEDIGYMPEERGLYRKMKVGEQLIYLARLKGMKQSEARLKIKEWLKRLDIDGWWNKNVEDLSKGMQQKVQFISTVLHHPQLLILDEPFSGLDPVNENIIRDEILALRKQGSTVIFSTHRMETVEELCDDIALINKSQKILEGKKKEIKEQHKTNTFLMETDREIMQVSNQFNLIECNPNENGNFVSKIKMLAGTNNELLAEVMQNANVVSFSEEFPSMHDIFIQLVTEKK
ncbi:MAG: ATP-binding cassette domain-containing protein [Cytophagales bacterium]|nr:MAG: ATP-binding cassette domain-containing protein [Cytophagales bacterium]